LAAVVSVAGVAKTENSITIKEDVQIKKANKNKKTLVGKGKERSIIFCLKSVK
jgi:hypothetical protein